MALRFLTEDLVTSVKRRSLVPVSQTTFEDSDIIALANEELGITIVPDIQSVREDLFLAVKEIDVTNLQTDYRLPERAIGSALKTLLYGTDTTSTWELPRIALSRTQDSITSGNPDSFYLKGDYITLSPTPNSGGILQMWYYRRPSEMVPTTEVATITAIADLGATLSLTVNTDLTGVLSTTVTADIFSNVSPSVIKLMDLPIVSVSASTIVITLADSNDFVVGDQIALSKTINTPLVPVEFHAVLAQAVACRLLEALGDLNKLQSGMAKLGEMRSQVLKLITNRVETAVEYFNSPYGISNTTGRNARRSAIR
jgi:hypothetical protein